MQVCRPHDGKVCISVELNGKQETVTPWPQTSHTEAERWAWCVCMLVIRCSMCKSKLYGSVRLYGPGIEEITVKFGFYLSLYVIGFIKYNAISVTGKSAQIHSRARARSHAHKMGCLITWALWIDLTLPCHHHHRNREELPLYSHIHRRWVCVWYYTIMLLC